MKILCIGDSLGLPRKGCPYESTWFYLLQQEFKGTSISHFTRALRITEALENYDLYYRHYKPDIVVIQTGIVDCAPRYINEHNGFVVLVIKLFKLVRLEGAFWRMVKLRKRNPKCVFTKYNIFLESYKELVEKFIELGCEKIVCIKIGHAGLSVLPRNPLMNINADKYNEAIDIISNQYKNCVSVINPLLEVDDEDFVDGYHCSPQGMLKVFDSLKNIINQLFPGLICGDIHNEE